tara:strand:+ start:11 stop:211 length:201 start_codon:yes stop_codon:yes gene_type:complete
MCVAPGIRIQSTKRPYFRPTAYFIPNAIVIGSAVWQKVEHKHIVQMAHPPEMVVRAGSAANGAGGG